MQNQLSSCFTGIAKTSELPEKTHIKQWFGNKPLLSFPESVWNVPK